MLVSVVLPIEKPHVFLSAGLGVRLLQRNLVVDETDCGKLTMAVLRDDDPVWRFVTPNRSMLWANGLDNQKRVSEAFALFGSEDEGWKGRGSYPFVRFFRVELNVEARTVTMQPHSMYEVRQKQAATISKHETPGTDMERSSHMGLYAQFNNR